MSTAHQWDLVIITPRLFRRKCYHWHGWSNYWSTVTTASVREQWVNLTNITRSVSCYDIVCATTYILFIHVLLAWDILVLKLNTLTPDSPLSCLNGAWYYVDVPISTYYSAEMNAENGDCHVPRIIDFQISIQFISLPYHCFFHDSGQRFRCWVAAHLVTSQRQSCALAVVATKID